jgi:mono/diheme cytochrome c family protein
MAFSMRGGLVPLTACGLLVVPHVVHAQAQTSPPPDQPATFNVDRIFATSCGWCHQGGGRVAGRGPKLAGTDKSDEFIISRIKAGKPPGMPAFGRSFTDEQLQAIVAYIRSLRDEP